LPSIPAAILVAILKLNVYSGSHLGSHFENTQDGHHLKGLMVDTIEFIIPKNINLNNKLMSLCGLEMKFECKRGILTAVLAAILKIQDSHHMK